MHMGEGGAGWDPHHPSPYWVSLGPPFILIFLTILILWSRSSFSSQSTWDHPGEIFDLLASMEECFCISYPRQDSMEVDYMHNIYFGLGHQGHLPHLWLSDSGCLVFFPLVWWRAEVRNTLMWVWVFSQWVRLFSRLSADLRWSCNPGCVENLSRLVLFMEPGLWHSLVWSVAGGKTEWKSR